MIDHVQLRDVTTGDLPMFFEQQLDPVATQMANFPPRDRDAFMAHWTTKVLHNVGAIVKTILFDTQVAGNIVCWEQSGRWLIGYWLGREYWGKGIATQALSEFLSVVKTRPLYAYVAKHNLASQRVLEKCGFVVVAEDELSSATTGEEIEDFLLRLE
jgi:RimJ/RimL family protein N-acetyltransferase